MSSIKIIYELRTTVVRERLSDLGIIPMVENEIGENLNYRVFTIIK